MSENPEWTWENKAKLYARRLEKLEAENKRLRLALNRLVRIRNDDGFALYLWLEEYRGFISDDHPPTS